jgi:ABC-type branched-subunit amino acid transport system substrate-binding protein
VFREVGTNDLFFIAEKDGAINAAEDNSMEVVLDTTVLSATEATSEETRNNYLQLISQLQIAKPDVVVGAVLEQGCQAFVMAAKELNYTADAWILSVCLNPDEYRQVVGEDGRYLIIPIDWIRD